MAENVDVGISLSNAISCQNAVGERAMRVCIRNLLFTRRSVYGTKFLLVVLFLPRDISYRGLEAFRAVGNVFGKKPGAARIVRTPVNIKAVRDPVLQSSRRSASKHAATPVLPDRSALLIIGRKGHFTSSGMKRSICNDSKHKQFKLLIYLFTHTVTHFYLTTFFSLLFKLLSLSYL